MSDLSVPPEHTALETREESLTRQFYEWEQRGRGWTVFDFPVELEPPFRPFYLIDILPNPIRDDGRKPTFLSNLVDSLRGQPSQSTSPEPNQLTECKAFIAQTNEPQFCQYYNEEFTELQLVLPNDLKVLKPAAEQLLLSFSYASHPVSFEIVGNAETIVVQIAVAGGDLAQVRQQIKSHVSQTAIIETNGFLESNWLNSGDHGTIVDFGLSNEFMLPLNVLPSFETDPLNIIIGALSDLRESEVGVFQVLLQKTRFDWAEEMINSVRCFDGTPFFINAPEMVPLAKQKANRPLFAAVVRVAAKSFVPGRAWQIVRALGAGLTPLSNPVGNELIPLSNDYYPQSRQQQALLDRISFRCGMLLNSEELVSLVHPPSQSVQSEKLLRESQKTKAAPNLSLGHSLVLGENHYQNEVRRVTLSHDQRTRHIHVLGSTGSGKTSLILNLIKQDMQQGQGLCVLDPHGDLIDEVIANVPEDRIGDVILFDPADSEYPVGFNILQAKSDLEKTLLASDLIATFKRMATSWGDVMDSVLANAILAFVESSRGGTLFELKRFLVERGFRSRFLESVTDDAVRYFWLNEFPLIKGKPQSSILIRLDTFLRQRLVRNIVCQEENKINFREVMDGRRILLLKLSQGLIGEENAYLLGTLLVSKLYQTALSRQDSPERPYFWVYLDEFHHFITPSMESILSGVRKYNVGLTLAHQEFRQLQSRSQDVAASILSNCYTRICFQLGDNDAEKFAAGFSFFDTKALQNLGVGEAIARIERSEYDFNLRTSLIPKVEKAVAENKKSLIVCRTREKYATPKADVEQKLEAVRGSSSVSEHVITENTVVGQSILKERFASGDKEKTPERQKSAMPISETESTTSVSSPEIAFDKDTQQHRYLQSLVKRMAESKGFRANIEHEVLGGIGKVDVALESDSLKIACEISVTNSPEYEVKNIQKCFAADYSQIVIISADNRHLQKIKHLAEKVLPTADYAKIHFFVPEEFHSWLEGLKLETGSEKRVKGFKVKTKLKPLDESERATRKRAISEIVFGALKHLKRKSDDK